MVLLEDGGHSKEILKLLDGGILVCIDRDIEAINKAIEELKADGTYQKIYSKWFKD